MKWWRIRKVANAATWHLMMVALGVLMGIALVAFLPGMPWSSTVDPIGATLPEMLDLAAQRSMASASWFMVTITAVSSTVGAASLLLIALTLKEARRSADAAQRAVDAALEGTATSREIGLAQARAYLVIHNPTMGPDTDGAPLITIECQNSGQTPALDVWMEASCYHGPANDDFPNHPSTSYRLGRPDIATGDTRQMEMGFGPAIIDMIRQTMDGQSGARLVVSVSVRYLDAFGIEQFRESVFHTYLASDRNLNTDTFEFEKLIPAR